MRNVIVSGGSRGLGLAMTQSLAAAGYRVIAVARTLTANSKPAIYPTQAESRR
jgi:3-oxoacyl-[acyl-carrier protein] reductase